MWFAGILGDMQNYPVWFGMNMRQINVAYIAKWLLWCCIIKLAIVSTFKVGTKVEAGDVGTSRLKMAIAYRTHQCQNLLAL